jgi:hypothetical protein
MIPEVAILNVIPEKNAGFEVCFEITRQLISSVNGNRGPSRRQNIFR